MLLLKQVETEGYKNQKIQFTFHYASIKTLLGKTEVEMLSPFTFHYASIKTEGHRHLRYLFLVFTFHYASIKTRKLDVGLAILLHYLHFIMLLLKHFVDITDKICVFTFTFHYASIKTTISVIIRIELFDIYISLCFY